MESQFYVAVYLPNRMHYNRKVYPEKPQVGKRTTVLELLACKDETLLVRGDALLALDLLLHVLDESTSRAHLFKRLLKRRRMLGSLYATPFRIWDILLDSDFPFEYVGAPPYDKVTRGKKCKKLAEA
eukprot:g25239.t1